MLKILYAPQTATKGHALAEMLLGFTEKGGRTLIVVPEQQVLETEGFVASLEGILQYRVTVASFRRIANGIFRKFGGLRYRYVGKGAKEILMWRTLMSLSAELKTLGGVSAEDTAKARQLLDTVEELKHFGVTPEMLESGAAKTEDSHLAEKLKDLSLLYSAYEALLNRDHDDAADDIARATAIAEDRGYFADTHILLDSFDGFTVYELALLKLMMKEAKDLTVTLAYDKDDMRKIFLKLKETDRRLRALAEATSVAVEEKRIDGVSRSPAVAYFSRNIWRSAKEPLPTEARFEESYRVLRCAGLYEEAAFVAADVAKRVQAGARYRDFTVIVRDVSRYQGILDAAFEGAGIPYFLSARKDAMAIPLVRLLFTALDVHCYGWRCEDVIAYMRSGLSGLTPEECDILEEYVTVWHISGKSRYTEAPWQMNPNGFSLTFDEAAQNRLAEINELRLKLVLPLTAFFEAFSHTATVRSVSEALMYFIRALGVSRLLREEGEQSLLLFAGMADREEHILFYDQLITLLDQLVDVAGDVKVTSREYSRLLYTMLAEADIGKLPARVDQVTVGNADLIRKTDSRYVYVMGLCQGVFPQPTGGSGFFDSEEKEKMAELGIETSPDGLRRLADEKLYYYRALTAAGEMTTLTYTFRAEDGKEVFPSSALLDTCKLFGIDPKTIPTYASLPEADKLYGIGEILEYGVNHHYRLSDFGDALRGRYATVQPLSAEEDSIPEALALSVTDEVIRISQSKLNKFVSCPFSYHCAYTLGIAEPKDGSMRSVDVGSYIHKMLERFALTVHSRGKKLETISDEEAFAILDELLTAYVAEIFRGTQSKRMGYLLKRLRGTTCIMVKSILEECRVSRFVPRFFELSIDGGEAGDKRANAFAEGRSNEPVIRSRMLDVGNGKQVVLRGEVDRVDVYTENGKTYLRVVDYKSGKKLFSMKDIEAGLNLQMLLYLFALSSDIKGDLQKLLGVEEKPVSAGVIYISLTAKTASDSKKPATEEESRRLMTKNVARSGLLAENVDLLSAMEKDLMGKYIPVTVAYEKKSDTTKLKSGAGLTLCTLEEMGALAEKVNETVIAIVKEMNRGKGHAKPLENKANDPCRYCKMKPICRTSRSLGGGEESDGEKGAGE